ncbi:MAG: copper chaperone PCu(A)C [Nitriliruptoraceae bacterium]
MPISRRRWPVTRAPSKHPIRVRLAYGIWAAVAVLMIVGCSTGKPDLAVGAAQAAAPIAGASQLVVEITNTGDRDDTLVGAHTPAAMGVEIHLTEIVDGRAAMRQLDEVALPAGETVRFRPGGLHLMLVIPDDSVVVGASLPVTFSFASSADITVEAHVVELLDLAEQAGTTPEAAS